MSHWGSSDWDSQNSPVSSLRSIDTISADNKQSPILSPASLTGADPPPTWHTLHSFLPIFELLGPKFVLDQDAYFIHGSVDDNDMEIFQGYSSMVTEFILTDGVDLKPFIDPSTFVHIAMFLGLKSGLLPSLSCLRIIQADKCFAYLHFLHTPSLRTLEAINVPDHQHPTLYSFLATLVHRAPLLQDVTLGGPGKFPLKSLQAILQFNNLCRLELRDAGSTISFTFLQGVGALPKLESFMLDARSCKYVARIPEEQSETPPAGHAEVGSQTPTPSSDIDVEGPPQIVCSPYLRLTYEDTKLADPIDEDIKLGDPIYADTTEVINQTPKPSSDVDCDGLSRSLFASSNSSLCPISPILDITGDKEVNHPPPSIDNQIPCDTNSSTSTGGFYQLKKLHFVGELLLVRDMIPFIASSTLEDISITVIRPSLEDLKKEAKIEVENSSLWLAETEERRRMADQETQQKIEAMEASIGCWGHSGVREAISKKVAIRRQEEEEIVKAETVQTRAWATFDLHTASYITVLQTISSKWSADLTIARFNQLDRSSQPLSTIPILPKQAYGTLFSHPKIETLEFKQWRLDSVGNFLSSLQSSNPQNLKQLHISVDDLDSAVSLSGLLDIAEACPMLESLQCCINTFHPRIPQYSVPTPKPLAHGLQTLSIQNNPTLLWDFDQRLLVAYHLYLTFPRIQTIDINMEVPNAEQWNHIRKLVKMYQVIRECGV